LADLLSGIEWGLLSSSLHVRLQLSENPSSEAPSSETPMSANEPDCEHEITVWLNQISAKPDEAMNEIWGAYFDRLVTYAKRKLGGMPRRAVDEEDIAAMALNSFFQAAKQNRFPDLNDRADLWKILLTITARKAGKQIRGHVSQKRGGGAIRGESVFTNAAGEQQSGLEAAAEPTEAFGELFAEELIVKLDTLSDPRLREIAIKKLEGFTNVEIADLLGCTVRTVERKLGRIRNAWGDS